MWLILGRGGMKIKMILPHADPNASRGQQLRTFLFINQQSLQFKVSTGIPA